MIVLSIVGPLSTVYVGGLITVLIVPLAIGSSLSVYLSTPVSPGSIGTADLTTAFSATAIFATYFAITGYTVLWRNIESYFSNFPWVNEMPPIESKITKPLASQKSRCPFTVAFSGKKPTHKCPSCQCRVHEDAFHEEDRLIEGLPGETLLRWDLAKYVTEMSGDIRQARRRMDEVLDFKGNVFSQGVASCCIGCATWQKSFNLAPRLSLSLVLGSMFFAYVPWGFPSFLALLGRGGVALKIASGSAAIAFATSGLLIQLRALGRANAFMSKYQANIPAFQPLVQFSKSSPKTTTYENILFSTVWDPLL